MPDESQICRTCLESKTIDEMISVFFKSFDEESLATMLKFFTSTKIEKNDGLPYFICAICAKNIKMSYSFKQQCEDSYEKLIRCMQETFNNEEDSVTTSSTEQLTHHSVNQELFELSPEVPVNLVDNVDEIMAKSEALDEYSECSFIEISSSPDEDVEIQEKLHSCDICMTFGTAEQLAEHKRRECRSAETPSIPIEMKECRVLLDKLPLIPNRPFKCFQCKNTFNNRRHLRKHESRHFGVKPLECDKCEKRFLLSSDLRQHKQTHKPFECDKCEWCFGLKEQLIAHIRGRH